MPGLNPRCGIRRTLLLVALSLPLMGIGGIQALFAPKKDPWPRWQAHDPSSTVVIDHSAWDGLLKRYLSTGSDGVNRVDYAALNAGGRVALDDYIADLTAQPVSALNRNQQLAYWINLYNAVTVRTVAEAYPVASIRDIDISPGLFADGPWGKSLVTVEGESLSLNDIEHRILRPHWDDPRIHYGVNCAAVGCPNLATAAYTGSAVDEQLDNGARAFVNSPRGVAFEGDRLGVSSIYAWFQSDFGGDDAGILAHLRTYAAPELRTRLETVSKISSHAYDWALAAVE